MITDNIIYDEDASDDELGVSEPETTLNSQKKLAKYS